MKETQKIDDAILKTQSLFQEMGLTPYEVITVLSELSGTALAVTEHLIKINFLKTFTEQVETVFNESLKEIKEPNG